MSRSCLKQIIDKHIKRHKKRSSSRHDAILAQREEECNISGHLQLRGGPYWSFVLHDSSYKLSCIIVDRASHLSKLIDLHGCLIQIIKGYIIVESYKKQNEEEIYVYLQFTPNEIHLLKRLKPESFEIIPMHWKQLILIVHVTPPVILKHCVFCLVLVLLADKGCDSKYLWFVLKESQVFWNDLLIPNREYILHMTESQDYFKISAKPLRAVLGKLRGIHIFKEVIHHPELWPTLQAIELPRNTVISIGASLHRSLFNCQYPSAWWQSISEALMVDNKSIITVWGEITRVTHVPTEDKDGCSLCAKNNSKIRNYNENIIPDQPSWTNPWDTTFKTDKPLLLPEVDEFVSSGIFMPDKITKVIVLKDIKSGKTVTLYLKKWSFHQYSSLFIPGNILCAKFVHKRVSAKQIPYFVSCALSSFEVIGDTTCIQEVVTCSSTKYGFPFRIIEPGTKSWGILDLWSLTKVTLKYEDISSKNMTVKGKFSATALIQVDRHTGATVNVVLKDDHVKILLEIPDDTWHNLSIASKVVPLLYSPRDLNLPGSSNIEELFHAFCAIRNLKKKRFHICCRLLPRVAGADEVYFCTSIGDANPEHLLNLTKPNLLSELLNKSLKD
ncbi:uncharacterized protein LOC142320207 [Lycorma delicatula]|uniref:uncharacterized protein LOC142320207 n=1 Tax=Lycorma delicatula TaxID=130591 RepID=UPI003F50D947